MYQPPPVYALIQAAKYLGVPVWDLLKQPVYWRKTALDIMSAENEAQNAINRRQTMRQRSR